MAVRTSFLCFGKTVCFTKQIEILQLTFFMQKCIDTTVSSGRHCINTLQFSVLQGQAHTFPRKCLEGSLYKYIRIYTPRTQLTRSLRGDLQFYGVNLSLYGSCGFWVYINTYV